MDRQGLIDLTLNAAIEIEKYRQKKSESLSTLTNLVRVLNEETIGREAPSKTYLMDLRNLAAYHNAWEETFNQRFDSLESLYKSFSEFLDTSVKDRSDENLHHAKLLCLALNHQFISSEIPPSRTRRLEKDEVE